MPEGHTHINARGNTQLKVIHFKMCLCRYLQQSQDSTNMQITAKYTGTQPLTSPYKRKDELAHPITNQACIM